MLSACNLPQIQWLRKSPGENSQSCREVHQQNMITLTFWESQPPLAKALCPVQERKQDSKTLSGIGDSGETKHFFFCLATFDFGFLMVYTINSASSKLYPSMKHYPSFTIYFSTSSDLVPILIWWVFVIFSIPALIWKKTNMPFSYITLKLWTSYI